MVAEPHDPLVLLLELTRKLAGGATLEESLAVVTDAALPLLGADHSSIRLLDEGGTALLCGARSGLGKTGTVPTFAPNRGVVGWVVAHGESARLVDAPDDPRFESRAEQSFSVRSLMALPLWSAGRVIGVLSVSHGDVGVFDDRAELMGSLLANCTVPAIERARLERLAVTDPRTRTFNRNYLVPRLEEEMARASRQRSPLSVLLMDLDHFKRVNDAHGHAAGDEVLESFADRVRAATRAQDVLIRWGGEEFVLVMPDTSEERAVQVAGRIRSQVAATPIRVAGSVDVDQTVSIGTATWLAGESPDALEGRADAAMYEAKRQGRDRVVSA